MKQCGTWSSGSSFFCLACVHTASKLQVLYFITFSSALSSFKGNCIYQWNFWSTVSIYFSILNKLLNNIGYTWLLPILGFWSFTGMDGKMGNAVFSKLSTPFLLCDQIFTLSYTSGSISDLIWNPTSHPPAILVLSLRWLQKRGHNQKFIFLCPKYLSTDLFSVINSKQLVLLLQAWRLQPAISFLLFSPLPLFSSTLFPTFP